MLVLLSLATLWLGFTCYGIWTFGAADHAELSDCAIVLGAPVNGAQPSPVFEQRIRHAVHLYESGIVKEIIFTGGLAAEDALAQGTVGLNFARDAGVPEDAMHAETKSTITRENLFEARLLMQQAGLSTAIIVSDPLHLKRAARMAEDIGISAVTSPTPTSIYKSLPSRLKFLLREMYFYTQYVLTGF